MTGSKFPPKACEGSQSVVGCRIKSLLGIMTIKEQCMQDLDIFYWLKKKKRKKNADITTRGNAAATTSAAASNGDWKMSRPARPFPSVTLHYP